MLKLEYFCDGVLDVRQKFFEKCTSEQNIIKALCCMECKEMISN